MSRSLRTRTQVNLAEVSSPEPVVTSDRPRRTATSHHKSYQEDPGDEDEAETEEESIIVERAPPQQQAIVPSIKLKLKMPASKLRESMTSRHVSVNSRDSFEPADLVPGPRPSRARRQVIMESDSDGDGSEEEADEEEGDDQDDGDEEEEEEADDDDDDEDDAEGESDAEMEDAPTPPVIRKTGPASKPSITITSAPKSAKIKSVEAKEISMAAGEDFDDDDLSDLSDDEDIVEEDAMEGEDDDEADSFDDEDLSRSGTPDLSKMTKRQRALVDTSADDHFMALNMGPQTKLHLTDEQRNFRRVEMARRRKNLSEKRNEEEKQDTINRLLKKQAPKRRGKISAAEIAAGAETPDVPMTGLDEEVAKADPRFSRWVSRADGCVLGVPVEWKGKAVAAGFGRGEWKAVEEVGV